MVDNHGKGKAKALSIPNNHTTRVQKGKGKERVPLATPTKEKEKAANKVWAIARNQKNHARTVTRRDTKHANVENDSMMKSRARRSQNKTITPNTLPKLMMKPL